MALFLIVSGWLVPLAYPHAGEDDPACARSFDGSETPALDGAAAGGSADHCLACHSARSFRSALSGDGWIALWLEPGYRVGESQFQSPVRPAADRVPARAPPAYLHTI